MEPGPRTPASASSTSSTSAGRVEAERLLVAARGGEVEALEELLLQHAPRLLLLVRGRMGTLRARMESQDVLQNVLLKAFSRFEQFSGPSRALGAWLSQIAEFEIRDLWQHHRRQRRDMAVETAAEAPDEVAARVTSITERLGRRERSEALAEALGGLSDEHREVIFLRYGLELEFAAIGERMDRSPDAARMLLGRAMSALTVAFSGDAP